MPDREINVTNHVPLTDEELKEIYARVETATIFDGGVLATVSQLRRLTADLRAARERIKELEAEVAEMHEWAMKWTMKQVNR